MKKIIFTTLLLFTVLITIFLFSSRSKTEDLITEYTQHIKDTPTPNPSCLTESEIESINSNISDLQKNMVLGARERTSHDVTYIDKAYSTNEGKPPDNEGVCTDHFWRALEGAGIDFQEVLYTDMKAHTSAYPLYIWRMTKPNKYIDFRRVPNVEAYLKRNAETLPIEVVECDINNLRNWQAGDIVIFKTKSPTLSDHIAIVSDKREDNGLPYLLHNYGTGEVEEPGLTRFGKIVGHYRMK